MRVRRNDRSKGLVVAFGGVKIDRDFVDVPAGCEAEAERHPFLEIEKVEDAQPEKPVRVVRRKKAGE